MLSIVATIYKDRKLDTSLSNPITINKLKNIITEESTIITDLNTYINLKEEFPNNEYILYDKEGVSSISVTKFKIITSIFEITDLFYDKNEYFIFGNTELYNDFLPYVNKMYQTLINLNHTYSDIEFPKLNKQNWKLVNHEEFIFTDKEIPYIESELIRVKKDKRRLASNLFDSIVNCTYSNENIFGSKSEKIRDVIDEISEIDTDLYEFLLEEYYDFIRKNN